MMSKARMLFGCVGLACACGALAQGVHYADMTDTCGIDFTHQQAAWPVPPLFPGQNERFGVGAAIGDFDNDGFYDAYIPNSAGFANHLYHNNGDGTFTEVGVAAGVDHVDGFSKQALWLDLNNDGFDDLVVFNDSSFFDDSFPTSRVYRNDGDGTFTDMTAASGLEYHEATHGGATAGDIDGDGDLDIFIGGWYEASVLLYRNDGNFRFTEISADVGGFPVDERFHWQPVMLDLNDDGLIDLFAAIDFAEDYTLRNNGDGTFTDVTHEWKTTHIANDMGVAVGDVDGNGALDLYTTNMGYSPFNTNDEPGPNALYMNDGTGVFEQLATEAGVDKTHFSWGTWLWDADLDGNLDLMAVNGWIQPEWHTRAVFFRGVGDGRFQDAGQGSGLDHRGDTRGLAPIDLDNDGDIDFILSDVYGRATVLRNDTERDGNAWLRVKAQGTVSNRNGVGSKVWVTVGDKTWRSDIFAGGSFYNAPPLEAHFGLGATDTIDQLRVLFPSGREVEMEDIDANQIVTVVEPR